MLRLLIILFFYAITTGLSGQDFSFTNYHKSDFKAEVLEERFSKYQVVDFDFDYENLEKKNGRVIESQFFFDSMISIDLYPSYLLSSEYEKSIASASKNLPMTYFGYDNESVVSLTFNNDFIYGFIRHQEFGEYYIEPLSLYSQGRTNQYVIYKSSDVISKEAKCGVNEVAKKQEGIETDRTLKASSCEVVQLAIASDFSMYERYGSIEAVENHNIGVMNCVNSNYIDQFEVNFEFEIGTQFVDTSETQFTTTADISTVLNEFIDWTAGAPWFNRFDLYQFWTATDVGGAAVGLSFLPGTHHVIEDFSSGAALQALAAHEIGHNFSATHVNSQTIMFNSVIVSNTWDPLSVSQINNRLTRIASTLENCVLDDVPIARINSSATVLCGKGVISLFDKSIYGTSRTWSASGGQISSTTEESVTFEATTPGTYTITMESANSLGIDSTTMEIEVQTDDSQHCTPAENIFGVGGLASWSILEGSTVVFSNSSSVAAASGNYENFYCTRTVSLEPNTIYNIVFTTIPCNQNVFQYFRIFIDYNDDGDFQDAGEIALASNLLWCGGPIVQGQNGTENGLIFRTPASPLMDSGLRLRVLVDDSVVPEAATSTCYSPLTGQIEDYRLVFGNINENCFDGIRNQGEESVDCGGPCTACVTGCDTDLDAYNYVPEADIEEPCETCFDGIQNGDEAGVDCGGSYPGCPSCASCADGIQNQGEESVDCGGPCTACVTGCDTDLDAYNYVPEADIDEPCETCFDGIQNGDEGGVDCGGSYPGCPSCASCTDGVQNQGEESVDCGGPCEPCTPFTRSVSGRIINPNGQAIGNVMVNIGDRSTFTDNLGRFSMDDLPIDIELSVAPFNNANIANGISSIDLILVTRHILGVQRLTGPYQLIAADVNANGTVSAVDLIGIQRVLLNITSQFDGRPSWIYVPEFADLSEASIRNGVQTAISLPPSTSDAVDLNFVGVKIGDVNASASVQ